MVRVRVKELVHEGQQLLLLIRLLLRLDLILETFELLVVVQSHELLFKYFVSELQGLAACHLVELPVHFEERALQVVAVVVEQKLDEFFVVQVDCLVVVVDEWPLQVKRKGREKLRVYLLVLVDLFLNPEF